MSAWKVENLFGCKRKWKSFVVNGLKHAKALVWAFFLKLWRNITEPAWLHQTLTSNTHPKTDCIHVCMCRQRRVGCQAWILTKYNYAERDPACIWCVYVRMCVYACLVFMGWQASLEQGAQHGDKWDRIERVPARPYKLDPASWKKENCCWKRRWPPVGHWWLPFSAPSLLHAC